MATNTTPMRHGKLPPLQPGDHLTLDEFLRRYEAMPNVKAELIDGRVVMPSPVRQRAHGKPHAWISTWLGTYEASTLGTESGIESTLKLDVRNGPQPDSFLRILAECGGQTTLGNDDYIEGGPELVVEVAASSVSFDLHDKLNTYRRHGVKEYLVWRVEDREIDWFVLRDGKYESLAAGEDGITRSETFPGLWLDRSALLRGELNIVLDVLRRGLETPEHAEFVARLKSASPAPRE